MKMATVDGLLEIPLDIISLYRRVTRVSRGLRIGGMEYTG